MAIGLEDLKEGQDQKRKSILDLILERKERRYKGPLAKKRSKKRTLRPWESFNQKSESDVFLSDEEKMIKRIKERAEELFRNLKF